MTGSARWPRLPIDEDDENHQSIRYRYSAFGAIVQGDFTNNPYGYTSRRFDHENGFYHYHFRKYDPVTGTWLTPDPIGIAGGINLYRFVSNNPVNYRDWLGLRDYPGPFGPPLCQRSCRLHLRRLLEKCNILMRLILTL
jgi:RHS repeat-associated protein